MTSTAANTGFSVSALLRTVWPTNTAKQAARVAQKSHRTVEGWLADLCCPSADVLMRMAANDDRLRDELLNELSKGRTPHASSLEEGPMAGRRELRAVDGGEDRPARQLVARQG